MKFYFDESGNFQLPPAGEHRVGIVSGIVIPDSDEVEIFRQFDAFLSRLPTSSFKNGEPKGRLLDDAGREAFADFLVALPGILLCPIMLDLTSLVGKPEADIAGLVSQKLLRLQAACKHQTFRDEIIQLATDVGTMSTQQCLRLAAWAKCIGRTINDSIIQHSGLKYESSWNSLRFEIDPVESTPGNREERVFETMLPMWVSSWSQNNPFTEIEGIHTPDHPLVKNWDCDKGLDVGKMFKNNVRYVSSASSKGIQLADMIATVVRRAVMGVANTVNLQNYGAMMTKTIGNPLHACGMFCLAPAELKDLQRRYYGIFEAINAARGSYPGSYSEPEPEPATMIDSGCRSRRVTN
jgi:hypothetical protein